MNNDATSRRRVGAVLMLVLFLAIASIITLLNSSGPKPTNDTDAQSSTQTNTDTNTAVSQNQMSTTNTGPDYGPLLDTGVSDKQVDIVQYALYQYAHPLGIPVTNVHVVKDSVHHTLPDSTKGIDYHVYDFTAQLDTTHSVKARLIPTGLYRGRVTVFDSTTNAQLYDSGELDSRSI